MFPAISRSFSLSKLDDYPRVENADVVAVCVKQESQSQRIFREQISKDRFLSEIRNRQTSLPRPELYRFVKGGYYAALIADKKAIKVGINSDQPSTEYETPIQV